MLARGDLGVSPRPEQAKVALRPVYPAKGSSPCLKARYQMSQTAGGYLFCGGSIYSST